MSALKISPAFLALPLDQAVAAFVEVYALAANERADRRAPCAAKLRTLQLQAVRKPVCRCRDQSQADKKERPSE